MAMPRRGQEQRRGSIQGGSEGTGKALRSATSGDRFFELNFGGEAVAITPDRQHRQFAAALPISHRAVLRCKASVDLDAVPFRSVPDIGELQIVLLGPEERHRVEAFVGAAEAPSSSATTQAIGTFLPSTPRVSKFPCQASPHG